MNTLDKPEHTAWIHYVERFVKIKRIQANAKHYAFQENAQMKFFFTDLTIILICRVEGNTVPPPTVCSFITVF